jgi:glyoxylase-like metal-dependent hydrolase (beta-lactamase superfamily II)
MSSVADVRVVLAPNPGVMTGEGTNQYVIGRGPATVIDVAPYDDENARRLADGIGGDVAQILLTHIHADHVGGARALADVLGAPVAVHRSRAGHATGGRPLAAGRLLDDGEEVVHGAGRLRVVHTPGHESGHCCYYDPDRRWLFTGDMILGTGTVVIPQPDGDMAAYLASLRRLRELDLVRILPGHGPAIDRPYEKIDEYIAHRLLRERQIVALLEAGGATVGALVARIYAGLPAILHPAAAMTVRAHLRKLVDDGVVRAVAEDRYQIAR